MRKVLLCMLLFGSMSLLAANHDISNQGEKDYSRREDEHNAETANVAGYWNTEGQCAGLSLYMNGLTSDMSKIQHDQALRNVDKFTSIVAKAYDDKYYSNPKWDRDAGIFDATARQLKQMEGLLGAAIGLNQGYNEMLVGDSKDLIGDADKDPKKVIRNFGKAVDKKIVEASKELEGWGNMSTRDLFVKLAAKYNNNPYRTLAVLAEVARADVRNSWASAESKAKGEGRKANVDSYNEVMEARRKNAKAAREWNAPTTDPDNPYGQIYHFYGYGAQRLARGAAFTALGKVTTSVFKGNPIAKEWAEVKADNAGLDFGKGIEEGLAKARTEQEAWREFKRLGCDSEQLKQRSENEKKASTLK